MSSLVGSEKMKCWLFTLTFPLLSPSSAALYHQAPPLGYSDGQAWPLQVWVARLGPLGAPLDNSSQTSQMVVTAPPLLGRRMARPQPTEKKSKQTNKQKATNPWAYPKINHKILLMLGHSGKLYYSQLPKRIHTHTHTHSFIHSFLLGFLCHPSGFSLPSNSLLLSEVCCVHDFVVSLDSPLLGYFLIHALTLNCEQLACSGSSSISLSSESLQVYSSRARQLLCQLSSLPLSYNYS